MNAAVDPRTGFTAAELAQPLSLGRGEEGILEEEDVDPADIPTTRLTGTVHFTLTQPMIVQLLTSTALSSTKSNWTMTLLLDGRRSIDITLWGSGTCRFAGGTTRIELVRACFHFIRYVYESAGLVLVLPPAGLVIDEYRWRTPLGYRVDSARAVERHAAWKPDASAPKTARLMIPLSMGFTTVMIHENTMLEVSHYFVGSAADLTARLATHDGILTQLHAMLAPFRSSGSDPVTPHEWRQQKRALSREREQGRRDEKERALHAAHRQRIKTRLAQAYKKIQTDAGIAKIRDVDAIYLGCCFDNHGKLKKAAQGFSIDCEHFVTVRFFDDDDDTARYELGKLSWPLICKLHELNGMEIPPHCTCSSPSDHTGLLCRQAAGSSLAKQAMVPNYVPMTFTADGRREFGKRNPSVHTIRPPRSINELLDEKRVPLSLPPPPPPKRTRHQ